MLKAIIFLAGLIACVSAYSTEFDFKKIVNFKTVDSAQNHAKQFKK